MMPTHSRPRLACWLALSITLATPFTCLSEETSEPKGAYGVVRRKQASSKRVIFQPLVGAFKEDDAITIHDRQGAVVCEGKVQKVYRDESYSVAENCEAFDDIRTGWGVSAGGDRAGMRDVFANVPKLEADLREKEWDRNPGVPLDLGEGQFDGMVKKSALPVFVMFYATWCPHCTRFQPIMGEVAKDMAGRIRVATIDAEKNRELAKEYGVQRYPTLFLLKKGTAVDSWTGAYEDKGPALERIKEKL